jgi:hypothetical protein
MDQKFQKVEVKAFCPFLKMTSYLPLFLAQFSIGNNLIIFGLNICSN